MVYQTGADSYLFFGSWAVVILPWVVISRFQPLWFIALLVANLALLMWADVHFHFLRFFGHFNWQMTTAFILLNESVLLLREGTTLIHTPIHTGRWFPRLVALSLIFLMTFNISY